MYTIQTLVTTMFQTDDSKYEEMNLQTDAIIANQCDFNGYSGREKNGKLIELISTTTRGVSRNRNIALAHATADIVVFFDDDMVLCDGYGDMIENEFISHPEAEAIKFYCPSSNPNRPLGYKQPKEFHPASKRELMAGGVIGVAIKKSCLDRVHLSFYTDMGPGNPVFNGEDSVFLSELINRKARFYLSPLQIGVVKQEDSSWFKGYDERYYLSAGYVYKCVYKGLSLLAIIRRSWKMRGEDKENGFFKRIKLMRKGVKLYKNRKKGKDVC